LPNSWGGREQQLSLPAEKDQEVVDAGKGVAERAKDVVSK
jgi:hypothetical protein